MTLGASHFVPVMPFPHVAAIFADIAVSSSSPPPAHKDGDEDDKTGDDVDRYHLFTSLLQGFAAVE